MGIIKSLKSFAEERIHVKGQRDLFLGYCEKNGDYEDKVIDETSFENCWKKYMASHS